MKKLLFLVLTCSLLFSCKEDMQHSANGWRTEHINGRNHYPIYEVQIPLTWKKLESSKDNLDDTRIPLATYIFSENNQTFTVTIHNFPLHDIDDQIPPLAQVDRWKKQFDYLETKESELKPIAYGGYTGQFFKGKGMYKGQKTIMLAWALQLPPEHYHALSHAESALDKVKFDQMRSDVTIKVIGPAEIVSKHREDIDKFVNSFHMIQAIPAS